ncbi:MULTISPECIES: septal ring lytic transglycosylase RlpA family protein [Giesbergeria]|uniref:Endolytic peptidoglycan transglycosylase RlpA n=1 Tax=Giesbergeria sinuosa TaxID=80883 RepID=A0ABV9QFX7_9BURK
MSLLPTIRWWRCRPVQLLIYALLTLGAGIASANDSTTPPPPEEDSPSATTTPPPPALGLKVPDAGALVVPVQSDLIGTDSTGKTAPEATGLPQVDLQFPQEYGLASWYGAKQHKKRTASGELFDMHDFTAAHPTLPFGSRVCVRSALTGREVVVRINDRGPHGGKRVIDISRAAAEALGMVQLGTKPVTLHTLPDDDSTCPPPESD